MAIKILLIQPPVEDFFFTPQRSYPLGLLSLATVLKKGGFEVSIYNTLERNKKQQLALPRRFLYLKKYYQPNRSPFCLFWRYQRFGDDVKTIEKELTQRRPRIVGIAANFTAYLDSSLETARIVKRIVPKATVVVGGRAVTVNPELGLREPSVDFVLRGEAEFSFLELCRAIEEKKGQGTLPPIDGLCYRDKTGKARIAAQSALIEDLDALPVVDHGLIESGSCAFGKLPFASMLASRGCNLGCSFCAIRQPLRWRSPELVLREMQDCFGLGIRHFNFEDDNINCNPYFERLIELIIERFGSSIRISFMNGVLSKALTGRLSSLLIKAGLTHLDFSIVSSQPHLRKKLHRAEDPDKIFDVASRMADKNIVSTAHHIIGFPGQAYDEALQDIRLLSGERVLLGASIFYPVAESKIFEAAFSRNAVTDEYSFYRSSAAFYDRDISRDRIFSLFYFSRVVNFIKQLIDKEKIERDFGRYLKERSAPLLAGGASGSVVLRERLDRDVLGACLLRTMLEDAQVMRVEHKRLNGKHCYTFKTEDFVEAGDVREFFDGLVVRSIAGRTVVLSAQH